MQLHTQPLGQLAAGALVRVRLLAAQAVVHVQGLDARPEPHGHVEQADGVRAAGEHHEKRRAFFHEAARARRLDWISHRCG